MLLCRTPIFRLLYIKVHFEFFFIPQGDTLHLWCEIWWEESTFTPNFTTSPPPPIRDPLRHSYQCKVWLLCYAAVRAGTVAWTTPILLYDSTEGSCVCCSDSVSNGSSNIRLSDSVYHPSTKTRSLIFSIYYKLRKSQLLSRLQQIQNSLARTVVRAAKFRQFTTLLNNNSLSFTPGLKPTCFTNPPPPRSFTYSSRTAFADCCRDRFIWCTRFCF